MTDTSIKAKCGDCIHLRGERDYSVWNKVYYWCGNVKYESHSQRFQPHITPNDNAPCYNWVWGTQFERRDP